MNSWLGLGPEVRRQNAVFHSQRSMARPQCRGVYFLYWREFIKIGHASDIVRRRKGIELGIPEGDVLPLGWIPCSALSTADQERKVHDALARYRVRGEWFRDCEEIRGFIDRHCMAWPA